MGRGRTGRDGVEGNMGEGTGFREAGMGWGGGIGDGGEPEEGTRRAWQHEVPQDRLF